MHDVTVGTRDDVADIGLRHCRITGDAALDHLGLITGHEKRKVEPCSQRLVGQGKEAINDQVTLMSLFSYCFMYAFPVEGVESVVVGV